MDLEIKGLDREEAEALKIMALRGSNSCNGPVVNIVVQQNLIMLEGPIYGKCRAFFI
jgi:hypothetical protein